MMFWRVVYESWIFSEKVTVAIAAGFEWEDWIENRSERSTPWREPVELLSEDVFRWYRGVRGWCRKAKQIAEVEILGKMAFAQSRKLQQEKRP